MSKLILINMLWVQKTLRSEFSDKMKNQTQILAKYSSLCLNQMVNPNFWRFEQMSWWEGKSECVLFVGLFID